MICGLCLIGSSSRGEPLKIAGISVIPHIQSEEMRYRREPDRSLGARVQLFLQNQGEQTLVLGPDMRILIGGKTPEELLQREEWAWHDFLSAWTNQSLALPAGALSVWNWNGRRASWGVGTQAELTIATPRGVDTPFFRETISLAHAVEFLGEPQYGGGRPVAPMDVWRALAPYQSSRLPTSVTHSDERIWRWYAGLSDYAHYDAYRVSAPAPDAWSLYDRWGGEHIRWGAPLETIGEMTRSLRDLNRPAPIAYWSQGAHEGWDSYGGRKRTSPTPSELRVQTWQALGARITSLYWFNLSLKSLVKFPDLIEPITRINREIRMLDFLLLQGDGTWHGRIHRSGGKESNLDWDTSVVAGPGGALCVATDLSYVADGSEKVFKFPSPRPARLVFKMPGYLRSPAEVVRVDADGMSPVTFQSFSPGMVDISANCGPVTLFIVSPEVGLAARLEARRRKLIEHEQAIEFDPAHNAEHLGVLRQLLKP